MKSKNLYVTMIFFFLILEIIPTHNSFLKLTETNKENNNIGNRNMKEKEKVSITQSEEKLDKESNEDNYEKVEIISNPRKNLTKTPVYAAPKEDNMKSPILIQTNESKTNALGLTERPNYLSTVIRSTPTSVTSRIVRQGFDGPTYDLEAIRKKKMFDMLAKSPHPDPNVMSFGNDNMNYVQNNPGIVTSSTMSVQTPNMAMGGNPGYLNTTQVPSSAINMNLNPNYLNTPLNGMMGNISVGGNSLLESQKIALGLTNQILPIQNIQSQSQLNPGLLQNGYTNTNIPPPQIMTIDSLPLPEPLPIPSPNSLIKPFPHPGVPLPANGLLPNSQTFNMKVEYKGLKVKKTRPLISDLSDIEEKINRINELTGTEVANIIEQLRGHELNLTNLANSTYKNLKQYQSQNNVIMESLREEINHASNQLRGMVIEVAPEEIDVIKKELEEEFTKSLEGYNINKNKYPHLRQLDPKEINDITKIIKNELNRNDKFYLHGDFTLF